LPERSARAIIRPCEAIGTVFCTGVFLAAGVFCFFFFAAVVAAAVVVVFVVVVVRLFSVAGVGSIR